MPKTIEGVNTGAFKPTTQVPQPGEARVAADIERVARDAFDNFAFLLAMQATLAQSIAEHGHALATSIAPGFMSPGDRQKLDDFINRLASHGHTVATIDAPGFMSKEDKDKLIKIEAGAHTVTRARVESALSIKHGSIILPASNFGGSEVKRYNINIPGIRLDDTTALSDTVPSAAQFLIGHRTRADEVEIYVKNLFSDSRNFEGGELRATVFGWRAPAN